MISIKLVSRLLIPRLNHVAFPKMNGSLRKISSKHNFGQNFHLSKPLICRFFATKTINVPFMGDSISEGRILEIHKSPGDFVEADEIVALVETDKTSIEIRSTDSGVIKEILQKVETDVKVDMPLFTIEVGATKSPKADTTSANKEKQPRKTEISKPHTLHDQTISSQTAKNDIILETSMQKPIIQAKPPQMEENVHIKHETAQKNGLRTERVLPTSKIRIKIAERLKFSQNTAASLTTFNDIDCMAILKVNIFDTD